MRYAIVIEREGASFGAYVPDLPGCVAIGESEDEVRQLIREAIEFHLEGLMEDDSRELAMISEKALAVDWNRDEEDQAWEDFQDLLVARERVEESRESLAEVRRRLIESGKLEDA